MLYLGIETSCDETSVGIIENSSHNEWLTCRSCVIASQIPLHQLTGGVVPEVAAREHALKMIPVLTEALKKASLSLEKIDAIAVTQGPGLLSSLLVGTTCANTLSTILQKPLIPTNHIAGHIYANWIDGNGTAPQFPIVVLTASGGHNELVLMRDHHDFAELGATLDDAAGEAFDKVARLLELGYPGGPAIEKAAKNGNPHTIPLPRAWLEKNSYDFSFSGLKTAVLRVVTAELEKNGQLSPAFVNDVAASFQSSVVDVLSTKLLRAATAYNAKEIHLAGGVSANTALRSAITAKAQGFTFRFPQKMMYCTDNGAMIAAAGAFLHKIKQFHSGITIPRSSLPL